MEAIELEVDVKHPAELVWQTHIKNVQISHPAAVPGHFSKVEFLEGPPLAAGGAFKLCYDEGFGHYDYAKCVWNEMDHDNYYCKLTEIDGGFLGKHFEKLIYHFKLIPSGDGKSCVMKWKIEYKDLQNHDSHGILKDELLKLSKSMEAYIDTTIKEA